MPTLKLATNLRCGTCVESIRPAFDAEPGISAWSADVSQPEKWLTVQGSFITRERVEQLLESKGYRVIGAKPEPPNESKTSYYPLLLILVYLLLAVGMVELAKGTLDPMRAMRHFMAGFFLVFSYFKLLDIASFANTYRTYDLVAKVFPPYGFLYPFIELSLGLAYLANWQPAFVNIVTLVVMSISTLGVVNSLLKKKKNRCACLGSVFNLPMSYVTLTEDVLMVAMSAIMLVL